MVNVPTYIPRGDPWNWEWERAVEQWFLAAMGEPEKGLPLAYTQYDGTGWANDFGSQDATNGRAWRATSQDGLKQINVANSGNNVSGGINISGGATISGGASVSGGLGVTGGATIAGNSAFANNLTIAGMLGVTGATTLSSTLAVTGQATFSALVQAQNGLNVTNADLDVGGGNAVIDTDGNINLGGGNIQLDASSGDAVIGGSLTVDGTTLVVDKTNNKVGVLTSSPGSALDVVGIIRSTSSAGAATTGAGTELIYVGGGGFVQARDRDAAAYTPLTFRGSTITLSGNGTMSGVIVNATGVGFNAASPVAPPALGGAATDLASVITLANNLRSMARNNGLAT